MALTRVTVRGKPVPLRKIAHENVDHNEWRGLAKYRNRGYDRRSHRVFDDRPCDENGNILIQYPVISCGYCGGTIVANKKNRRWCSKRCARKGHYEQTPGYREKRLARGRLYWKTYKRKPKPALVLTERKCEGCDAIFIPGIHNYTRQRWCTHTCRNLAYWHQTYNSVRKEMRQWVRQRISDLELSDGVRSTVLKILNGDDLSKLNSGEVARAIRILRAVKAERRTRTKS